MSCLVAVRLGLNVTATLSTSTSFSGTFFQPFSAVVQWIQGVPDAASLGMNTNKVFHWSAHPAVWCARGGEGELGERARVVERTGEKMDAD